MDPETQADAPNRPQRVQRGQRYERWMRLVRQRDFARAYREGSRARGSQLTLVAAPNDLGYSRLGLSIGRRYHRHAVVRNLLRRTVREAFRLEYGDLPKGMDLVAVGSEPGVTPDLAVLRREMVQLAARAVKRLGEPRPPRSARKKSAAAKPTAHKQGGPGKHGKPRGPAQTGEAAAPTSAKGTAPSDGAARETP